MKQINNNPTSFCCNCGEVVAWEMPFDDPDRNKLPCGDCAKLVADFIAADEKLASAEAGTYEMSRKMKFEAEREQALASQKLRARRRIVANERTYLINNN